jgi:Histidine kinase-, DNA gyrase B-, and HSP90-like ATPase/GAF domain
MIEYKYARIGGPLLKTLERHLMSGESFVLLGPRNIGKRFVLMKLRERLVASGRGSVARVSFLTGAPHHDVPAASTRDEIWLDPDARAVMSWVDAQLSAEKGVVTLLAANVDCLPQEPLREFLAGVRQRVEGRGVTPDRRLAVVLTGEVDLSRVLLPPLSPFTCAHQYVLQGFDGPTFNAFARHSIGLLNGCIKSPDDNDLAELFKRTGGNTYYLRLVLWSVFDRLSGRGDGSLVEWIALDSLFDADVASQTRWTSHLQYVSGLIDNDADCWSDLERLMAGEPAPAPRGPHLLELAGIAVRVKNQLEIPGSLTREFVSGYYTKRRFADHFARAVCWPEAFRRYNQLAPEERRRPTAIEDVADAGDIVKELRTSLYHEAIRGPVEVLTRFNDGCRSVLGFPEVTLWRFDQTGVDSSAGATWQVVVDSQFQEPRGERYRYAALLPKTPQWFDDCGWLDVGDMEHRCVVAVRLPTSHPDIQEVILVGTPGSSTILSNAGATFARALAADFIEAYRHALLVREIDERLKTREEFARIVNGIVSSLGRDVRDVRHALVLAAQGLRTLGYRRVLFSLMDPSRSRIEAVVEDSDDPRREALKSTSHSLDDAAVTGHVWVVRNKQKLVMRDAATDGRIHNEAARRLGARGVAIVPLIDPNERVIGTVSVERADGMAPTEKEVEILEQFGRQLAGALMSCEHIELLQAALDTKPAPIAIFEQPSDDRPRLRYANPAAGRTLGVEGWFPPGTGPTIDSFRESTQLNPWVDEFEPLIRGALRDGKERYRAMELPVRNGRSGSETIVNLSSNVVAFKDWRGNLDNRKLQDRFAGVVCHVRNETYVYQVFQVIRSLLAVEKLEGITEQVVNAVRLLGHKRGRLYLVDRDSIGLGDPQVLVSESSFGIDDDDARRKFDAHEYRLNTRGAPGSWETWYCIDERGPVLLHHDPDKPDHEIVRTDRGLEAVNSRNPSCPAELRKQPGHYWIDFPLLAGDHAIGKLTLDCDPWKNPREFEFLNVLCALVTPFLGEWLRRELSVEERLRDKQRNDEKAYRDVMHDLGTELVPARMLLNRYRKLSKKLKNSDLASLNEDHTKFCDHLEQVIDLAYLRSLGDELSFQRIDFRAFVEESLRSFPVLFGDAAERKKIEGLEKLETDLDPLGFRSVMRGLLHNSIWHYRKNGKVTVRVKIDPFTKGDAAWVRLTYTDDGSGVPESLKEEIFTEGFSSRPEGRAKPGLGLASARRIISAHDGAIWEDGAEGKGARFVIEIPRFQKSRPQRGSDLDPRR